MNVLYISHTALLNGAPKSLLEYVENIKNQGVNPIVVIPSKGNLKTELDKKGIKNIIISYKRCVYSGKYSVDEYIKYLLTNLKAVYRIVQVIREEQIDIVHTNTIIIDVGAISACIAGVPHIWHLREYLEEHFDFKFINPRTMRTLIKKSSCHIAIANGIKRKYKREYNINAIRIYNGLESDLYYQPVKLVESRKKLLIAGTVSEDKGQWDAVRAVEILVRRGIEVFLDIVGEGEKEYISKLKKYVKSKDLSEYISFHKYTNNLQEMRLQSDIVLVCSKKEAFGRVTAEAMMAGKIVIGTNTGGTKELIGKKEERGYLYTYNHPEELAEKIYYVITYGEEVYRKEKRAQKFILELTNMERYTDKIVNIYQKILANK